MSDIETPTQPTVDTETAAVETDEIVADHDTTDEKPGAEAAKYRRRLRDTEAERDNLASRVETLQRAEVERLAATDLDTPSDLWLAGPALSELLDDSGQVDPAKVTAAVAAVLDNRPGWRRNTVASFDGGARTSVKTPPLFQEVLQGRRHR